MLLYIIIAACGQRVMSANYQRRDFTRTYFHLSYLTLNKMNVHQHSIFLTTARKRRNLLTRLLVNICCNKIA